MVRNTRLLWLAVMSLLPAATSLHAQTLKAPQALAAASATKSEVRLTWSAVDGDKTGYLVERKPLGGQYATVGRAADTAYADQKIEQFATYVYRVRTFKEVDAPGKPGGKELTTSAPSNEITVGPPPVGISVVSAAPAGREANYAHHVATAFDANGDPAIAFSDLDPDGNEQTQDAEVRFVAWNRALYKWNPAVRVAPSGDLGRNLQELQVSMARDDSSGLFVVAFQTGKGDGRGVSLGTSSDAGVPWQAETIEALSEDVLSSSPSVAAGRGTVHLTYRKGESLIYRTRAGAAGAWTRTAAPIPDTKSLAYDDNGVVLDGTGRPAVFYWLQSKDEIRVTLAYWRPGEPNFSEAAFSTSGSDDMGAALAFAGTQPRFAFNLRRDDNYEDHLWFTSSSDGRTWTPPQRFPLDVRDYWNLPVSLAIDSRGRAAAMATITGGAGASLGRPKFLRSDDLKTWRVTSADANKVLMSEPTVGAIVFAANDKLYIPFHNHSVGRSVPAGLLLWREP